MSLNEKHIDELLNASTPAPWNVAMLDLHRETGLIDNDHAQAYQKLSALAPELATDWLRMRRDLEHLAHSLGEFSDSPGSPSADEFAVQQIHGILNREH